MRRLLAVLLFCAGIFCLAQSRAQVSMTGAGLGAPTVSGYTAQGVHFNGSTELWNPSGLTAPLAVSTDGKKGTLSMWIREDQDGTTDGLIAAISSGTSSGRRDRRGSPRQRKRPLSRL
jgi:hypothetical protein